MKRALLAILCLLPLVLFAAPGEMRTNTITLSWDPSPPHENVLGSNLYVRTNFPPGMPQTNAPMGEVMNWTPTDTNGWSFYRFIEGGNVTNVTLTNVWSGNYSAAFFVITATNAIGESSFSNVAWIPSAPRATNRFRLTLAE